MPRLIGLGGHEEREREREFYFLPWLQVHIMGGGHEEQAQLRLPPRRIYPFSPTPHFCATHWIDVGNLPCYQLAQADRTKEGMNMPMVSINCTSHYRLVGVPTTDSNYVVIVRHNRGKASQLSFNLQPHHRHCHHCQC